MKNDTQHLEFLISQFVDGTLDASTRKTIEQQLLTDPVARRIYKEQHETQELLDDWGNRLPLINWAEFDNVLAARLEKESAIPETVSPWRKWSRPLAIAASLFIAAGVGYLFHAMQSPVRQVADTQPPITVPAPFKTVIAEGPATPRGAGFRSVDYSMNVPNKSVAGRNKIEISGDPGLAVQQGMEEGSAYWPITPDGTGNPLSLPQTRPGAVRAEEFHRGSDIDGLQ